MRFLLLTIVAGWLISGCSPKKPITDVTPAPAQRVAVETVTVKDPEAAGKVARLEMRLMERDAQVEDLLARLDEARGEAVRAMAKLQTLASRAEAASGMAEAEVALQSLKTSAGQQSAPEVSQATRLLDQSSGEFNKQNYGGALYLANQAKTIAGAGRGRLAGADRGATRPGETAFAVPVPLKTVGRGNVREGPAASTKVAFSVGAGTALTGYSYLDEWIRVSDEGGRTGWIFRALVGRR